MDESTQTRLFQRFAQADSSMTRRYGGSGLGLVICKNLVESMGGQIHVKSAHGQGSSFWFELPLDAALQASPVECASEWARVVPAETPGLRVLVVEDNLINQMVIRSLLEQRGANVTMADNGQLGLEAAKSQAFDLVFMDCQMPVMDGFEATRQIRTWEKTQQGRTPVPIVALTANVQDSDREACLAAGMSDFTTKPIKGEVIDRILASYRV
jgi:CheY-like chemotaxis protein